MLATSCGFLLMHIGGLGKIDDIKMRSALVLSGSRIILVSFGVYMYLRMTA